MNDTSRFAGGTEMQFTKRQSHSAQWLAHAAAAIGIGLLLGYLGPFRTGTELVPAVRYAFWLCLALFGYACILAAMRIVPTTIWGPIRLLLLGVASAVPQTFATAWTLSLVQQGRTFGPLHLLPLFGAVLVVQLVIALVAWAVAERGSASPEISDGGPPAPAFLERVPARLGRELVALEAEDHYLRVHTALGSELLLMRLSDAVSQLESYNGLQVHRSWWVAADAVAGTVTRDGRFALQLKTGLTAPVSRTYLPAVRERRWPLA